MAQIGSEVHERYLDSAIEYLQSRGHRCINLRGRSPDAIVVTNAGRIFALEVLKYSKRGDDLRRRTNDKIWDYSDLGVDNVLVLRIDINDNFSNLSSAKWVTTDEEIIQGILNNVSLGKRV